MTTRQRFILTIEHHGGGCAFLALRQALKVLLRRFGFRCVRIERENAHGENHEGT